MLSKALSLAAAGNAGGEETDPNFNQTVLLLHGDGTNGAQNNTFLDSSTNNFTITRNGNTTQGTFSPFSAPDGRWSNYFDGSGDRLTSSGSVNSAVGSGDFCVEFFVYYTSYPQQYTTIFSTKPNNQGSTTGYGIGVENDGTIYNYSNGYIAESASGVFSLNTWHHMVFTRSGTTARLFLDGVLRATGTNSQNFSNEAFSVGSHVTGVGGDFEPMNGYVSNVRLSKGSIPTDYQTASTTVDASIFTVPTSPLTASSEGATSADVEILTCQSNRFVDNSTNNFAITRNGDVKVTPFSPFAPTAAYDASVNGGSGYFDGSDDLRAPTGSAALGSSDFTIETWIYPTVSLSGSVLSYYNYSTNQRSWQIWVKSDGGIEGYVSSTGSNFSYYSGGTGIKVGQWNHIALTRSSGTVYGFINGVQVTSFSYPTFYDSATEPLVIANRSDSTQYFSGYVAGTRIINGTCLYSGATYTIPTAPPTAVTNTQFLANYTNAGIFDNTGKNDLETVGNAQIDTTTKKYGTGSMEFDGTGDYLLMGASTPDLLLGTGPFTIEFWFNTTSSTRYAQFIGNENGTTGESGFTILINNASSTAGDIAIYRGSSGLINSATGVSYRDGSWYHLAFVRDTSGSRLYIDGVQKGTTTAAQASTSFDSVNSFRWAIGSNLQYAGRDYLGFIDDLRITKGVARYTTTFTPPTAAFPNL